MLDFSIGFMQGRLCDCVDGKIQAFPWHDWQNEFPTAASIDFHLMEWTLDQQNLYENPLLTVDGQIKIRELSQRYDISIPSLTGDCFMHAPFWKASGPARTDLQLDFMAICRACAAVDISMIVVPLVDNGRLATFEQENILVDFLLSQTSFLADHQLKVIFECDLVPLELARFIDRLPVERFGINYDTGNSAALGYNPSDEFSAFGERIMNVHVKDRVLGGTTVPLNTGNVDFSLVFSELAKIGYSKNIILQTARATDRDHIGVITKYRDMVLNFLSSSTLD